MMKKIAFIGLMLLITLDIFACRCAVSTVSENFMQAEIVIRANVQKVYPNTPPENHYYKIDIDLIEVYKGQVINSLEVYGTSNERLIPRTSCDKYTPENTEWIIYTSTNEHGNMTLLPCSSSRQIDPHFKHDGSSSAQEYFNSSIQRELETLKLFKNEKIKIQNNFDIHERGLSEALEKYKGIQLDKSFAMFELTFNSDVTVKAIRKLSGFNTKLDKELIIMLKNCKWKGYYNGAESKVPEETKWLICIYYYSKEDSSQNLLTYFNL